jgi:hypothetical protein
MKKRIIVFVVLFFVISLLWLIGIYLSGWHVHRCPELVGVYLMWAFSSIAFSILAATAPDIIQEVGFTSGNKRKPSTSSI